MIIKDWYRGLLRFLPKAMLEQFKIKNQEKKFPQLDFFDKSQKKLLEKMIGSRINNIAYFEQALTHRSYLSVLTTSSQMAVNYSLSARISKTNSDINHEVELPKEVQQVKNSQSAVAVESNERLEFLGDSVLGLIVSDYLFNFFPNVQEGELTKMRARLVNKHTLALAAKNVGLQQFIKISFGTEKNFEKAGETIIADAFEALVAAIYIDLGIEKAVAFLYKNLLPLLELDNIKADTNYKSKLLEFVQSTGKKHPIYNVIMATGPDHDKEYTIGVFVEEILLGTGIGKSKKDAEQNAAKDAMVNLQQP